MKRVIIGSVDNLLGEYSKYYEIDNPDDWEGSDTEEVFNDCSKICEDAGYTFISPITAKSQFYDYLGLFADAFAAKDSNGDIRIVDLSQYEVDDITEDVDDILSTLKFEKS